MNTDPTDGPVILRFDRRSARERERDGMLETINGLQLAVRRHQEMQATLQAILVCCLRRSGKQSFTASEVAESRTGPDMVLPSLDDETGMLSYEVVKSESMRIVT